MRNVFCVCLKAAAALAILFAAGCAGVPETPVPVQGIPVYRSETASERRAQKRLFRSDEKARGQLAKAMTRAGRTVNAYAQAARRYHAEQLPPGVERPTQEELDALREAAERTRWAYWKQLNIQVDRYDAFLKTHPENWYVRHRFAWFLADHNLHYEAADEWCRVVELAPDFAYAYNNLASLYNHMGRDAEAMDLLRKAIALLDDDPVFHINLAVNYSTHRREAMAKYGWDLPQVFEECIASYTRARDLAPKNPEIAYALAGQYVLAKFFTVENTSDRAIEAWKYYLSLSLTPRQRAVGQRNIGRICFKEKNDPSAAVRWFKRAIELNGDQVSQKLMDQARRASADKGTE